MEEIRDPLVWLQRYTKTKDPHWREAEKSRDLMISWLMVGLFTHTVMSHRRHR